MNKDALQAFIRSLREDADVGVRLVAAEALRATADPAAVPALVDALRDGATEVRQAAIQALTEIGPPSIPHLTQAMHSPEALMRTGAATVLGALSSLAPEATEKTLVSALGDKEIEVRRLAAYALGERGQVDEVAYDALIAALADPEAEVRRVVAEAIGKLVPHGEQAIAPLTRLMLDHEVEVRRAAAEAVKQIAVG
jgi:HEAT repeat protein